ncbi:MAG: DUF4070 domain-containing protein [Chitinivibrionales bacterium]|nr:DUF4070 domain-containing protein [Chitinivibrionales bacterium]
MRILLISPGTDNDLDSRFIREVPYLGAKVLFGPTAVATVAALTPPEHEVVIHDEHMRGPVEQVIDTGSFDVVGVNLTTNQFTRATAIADHTKRTAPRTVTVAGGIGAPGLLHSSSHRFDVVFYGEAEDTWPQFLRELQDGRHKRAYHRYSKPDLTNAPAPAWERIAADIPRYGTLSVQTTRGCPHDCAFCDVIYTYGRRPRSKAVGQVLEEIRLLERLGASMIFVADDNFGGGNREYARELLQGMVALNNSFAQPLIFMTQVDILIARDKELLELMADANFADLMIGIESVDEAALRDMNKLQNLRIDPVEAVRTIQSYGIAVLGHMIIGNDSDDSSAFGRTETFVEQANILHHFCHPLMAPPGTRLWHQYAREGRLIKLDETMRDRMDIVPNTIPKRMTRVELLEGLADYWERVNSPEHYLRRALGFLENVTRRPRVKKPSPKALGAVFRLLGGVLKYYLFGVSKAHRRAFFTILKTAGRRKSWLVPKAIFLYTCYMLDHKRALHDAAVARQQAAWEREHPDRIEREDPQIPLAAGVRDNARDILQHVYARIRPHAGNREALYGVAVDALIEFSDRFGAQIEQLTDIQRSNLTQVCDRVLSARDGAIAGETDLPEDKPPPGFVREVLDAADSAVRVRGVAEPS